MSDSKITIIVLHFHDVMVYLSNLYAWKLKEWFFNLFFFITVLPENLGSEG